MASSVDKKDGTTTMSNYLGATELRARPEWTRKAEFGRCALQGVYG